MNKAAVHLPHCQRNHIPRRVYRLPNNDIQQANYSPWVMLYVATCQVCRQSLMAYQALDDIGEPYGPITGIKAKHHQRWLERARQQGNSLFRHAATHVKASRKSIPYDVILVPVQ